MHSCSSASSDEPGCMSYLVCFPRMSCAYLDYRMTVDKILDQHTLIHLLEVFRKNSKIAELGKFFRFKGNLNTPKFIPTFLLNLLKLRTANLVINQSDAMSRY